MPSAAETAVVLQILQKELAKAQTAGDQAAIRRLSVGIQRAQAAPRTVPALTTDAYKPPADQGPPLPKPETPVAADEPSPFRVLPPPRGGRAAPQADPQSVQLDAMRKDVNSAGQPGARVTGDKGTPGGHEVGSERLALIRQQAEVDEYGRTLSSLITAAQMKAYESSQQGGPNFVPLRDPKNGKLFLVSAGGNTFEFDTRDPADMAHFRAAVAQTKLDPAEVVQWANTVSEPLKALLAPMGQPGQAAPAAPGPSMFSHAEFVSRLKQARTPQEADAIVQDSPFSEHPEAANLSPDDPLSQRIGAPPSQAAPKPPTPGAQHNTFMRGQQQQFNQAFKPQQIGQANPYR